MHWILTAFLWWGIFSAAVCTAVTLIVVAIVVYDRRLWHRWLWNEDR